MTSITRRNFMAKSFTVGLTGIIAPIFIKSSFAIPTPNMTYDDISIAQWALVNEIREGEWGTEFSVSGGADVEISTPDSTGWFAVLFKAD